MELAFGTAAGKIHAYRETCVPACKRMSAEFLDQVRAAFRTFVYNCFKAESCKPPDAPANSRGMRL